MSNIPHLTIHDKLSDAMITEFMQDYHSGIRKKMFGADMSQESVIFELQRKPNPGRLRLVIASDWRCPPELLTELAYSEHHGTRAAVAENPNTPVESLAALLPSDTSYMNQQVIGILASNPRTPPETLVDLTKLVCNDKRGFSFVYRNPRKVVGSDTSEMEYQHLHDHENHSIIVCLAKNPASTSEIIDLLLEHTQEYRNLLCSHPSLSVASMWKIVGTRYEAFLTYNPNTPHDIYEKFMQSGGSVLKYVAKGQYTPLDILEQLIITYQADYLRLAANSPLLNVQLMLHLISRRDILSIFRLQQRKDLPKSLREIVAMIEKEERQKIQEEEGFLE